MRLAKIRLAGFKSFVDPTTVQFPSDLTGIVGPNGCGKSNVIDAVRWVMGESSAKVLRGDSMADVIFNGSSTRKPVGTALVELIFDNSDGAIGGQYASFAEISCKRVVSRDGVSAYYLNGTRCRRRDITDIFLGTGLGPRSYSIIEQGMISQFVEAKPDDLRVYLEEAAGISRYKERRRETENRIRHTRDNLARLNDLREEVDKQIQHLKRQARAAERYKLLKTEQRRREAELLALRWRELDTESSAFQREVDVRQTEFEKAVAKQRRIETELEKTRALHDDATGNFNKIQGELYEVGAEIARLEQAILHARQLRQEREKELAEADEQHAEIQEHIALDRVQTEELRTALAKREPELESARAEQKNVEATLKAAEQALSEWQAAWDAHTVEHGEQSRKAEVEQTRIDQLDRQLMQLGERRKRLEQQLGEVVDERIESDLDHLSQEAQGIAGQIEEFSTEAESLREAIASHQTENGIIEEALHELRQNLEDARGRRSSLHALQEAALGDHDDAARDWLRDNRLLDSPRLADLLDVDDGWETAVQTVLEHFLETRAGDADLERIAHAAGSLQSGTVGVIAGAGSGSGDSGLARYVRGPMALRELLHGVHAADTLEDALQTHAQLEPGASVITRDGLWLGRSWLRVSREADEETGVLHRRRAIRDMEETIGELESGIAEQRKRLEQGEEALDQLETDRSELQDRLNTNQRRHAEVCGRVESKRASLSQHRERRRQISEELQQTATQIEEQQNELQSARQRLEQAIENMARLQKEQEALKARKADVQRDFDHARDAAAVIRDKVQRLAIEVETKRAALGSTEQTLERMSRQQLQLETRREQLRLQVSEDETPQAEREESLKQRLDVRLEMEQRQSGAREKLEGLLEELHGLEKERMEAEKQAQELRGAVEEQKISGEGVRVRAQTVQEEIARTGYEMQQLLAEMPDEASVEGWKEQLEKLERRINRLGPINLAAIPEYEQQSERKAYLDSQHDDLEEALQTLEAAIRKIDRDTRTRFKETFDRVNQGLQELFPRLFGGGHAYLEMTGQDLLDTGIAVMARPPGKRVTNIHLLSGGEKALTAVALVFAIFHLNPAPFCMLDEVDAPLDDANVGRFCEMVSGMADKIQFVIVTHNKLTMETVNQLTGVTMSEPGVSRLVAVDIEEAALMAAS